MQGHIFVALFHLCQQGKHNLLIFANKVLYMLADCGRVYFPKVFQIRSAVGRLCVNRKRNNAISTHV